ncbi:MAG: Lrp/AsnC ligand binding domain-containing protein [Candidatus Nitrosopolaris sp.]|jgi:DNA-binding Lrp family transcriptional regulator
MPTAYVLINCDVDHKNEVMNQLDQLPGIFETVELHGAYDILARFNMQSVEELKDTIKFHLKKIPDIKSTVTLIAIEPLQES